MLTIFLIVLVAELAGLCICQVTSLYNIFSRNQDHLILESVCVVRMPKTLCIHVSKFASTGLISLVPMSLWGTCALQQFTMSTKLCIHVSKFASTDLISLVPMSLWMYVRPATFHYINDTMYPHEQVCYALVIYNHGPSPGEHQGL